jgi:hypothetical protein
MEHVSVLQSIAEVGVALAGFGGLAAGLGYRTRGDWSGDDKIRLFALVTISLSVVFACYLPSAVNALGSPAPWRIASAVFLLVPLSLLCGQIWLNRRGVPIGYSRAAIGLLLLDGLAIRFSMGAFAITVDAPVMLVGLAGGLLVGLVGAIPPAARCLQLPITEALKAY